MSRLVANIKASRGDERKAIPSGVVAVKSEFQRYDWQMATAYTIGLTLSARAFVADGDSRALHAAIESTQRSVIEEVFGEFREPLAELERALWERDVDKAVELTANLRNLMFTEALREGR